MPTKKPSHVEAAGGRRNRQRHLKPHTRALKSKPPFPFLGGFGSVWFGSVLWLMLSCSFLLF